MKFLTVRGHVQQNGSYLATEQNDLFYKKKKKKQQPPPDHLKARHPQFFAA